jgi:peroxiredoxin
LIRLAREYGARGVQFVAICANDAAGYPDDAFDKLEARWRDKQYGFPYLHDESQEVARAFGAVCTPDIFVYDRARRLAYRGRIDDAWKDESKVTRRELAAALDALLAGVAPAAEQRPSLGCSIKWKD